MGGANVKDPPFDQLQNKQNVKSCLCMGVCVQLDRRLGNESTILPRIVTEDRTEMEDSVEAETCNVVAGADKSIAIKT